METFIRHAEHKHSGNRRRTFRVLCTLSACAPANCSARDKHRAAPRSGGECAGPRCRPDRARPRRGSAGLRGGSEGGRPPQPRARGRCARRLRPGPGPGLLPPPSAPLPPGRAALTRCPPSGRRLRRLPGLQRPLSPARPAAPAGAPPPPAPHRSR